MTLTSPYFATPLTEGLPGIISVKFARRSKDDWYKMVKKRRVL